MQLQLPIFDCQFVFEATGNLRLAIANVSRNAELFLQQRISI